MKEKISMPSSKQFRGKTKITLCDAATGEVVKKVEEENLYNQRIQILSYIDTILKCKPTDYSDNNNITLTQSELASNNIRGGTDNHINPWGVSGSANSNNSLFNTLWLTNATADPNVLGYPNGIPIAIGDNGGVPVTNYTCVGNINLPNCYVANDRIHMEWDFPAERGNYTFDSVWLYPSAVSQGGTAGQRMHQVRYFFDTQTILSKQLTSPAISSAYTNMRLRELQSPYILLEYRTSTGSPYTTPMIQILNEQTGELLKTYSFATPISAEVPFWYDESTDMLYQISAGSRGGSFIWEDSTQLNGYLIVVDCNTGTTTSILLRTLLGMTLAGYGMSSSTATSVDCFYLADGSTPILGVAVGGVDAVTGDGAAYYSWFRFDPLTTSFTLINKVRTYSQVAYTSVTGIPAANFSSTVLLDNKLYLSAYTTPNPDVSNFITVYDVKTGAILSNNGMSIQNGALSYRASGLLEDLSGTLGYTRTLRDTQKYKQPRLTTSVGRAGSTVGAYWIQEQYLTAPWSTHNKLTSAITKTSSQTMKIEYDIIWDSIEDVLIPGLL